LVELRKIRGPTSVSLSQVRPRQTYA